MITKTIRLPEDLSARIGYRAKKEDVDESDAIRQEASRLADVSLREMLDLLMEHGIKGNVTLKQQQRSLEYVERMLESQYFILFLPIRKQLLNSTNIWT